MRKSPFDPNPFVIYRPDEATRRLLEALHRCCKFNRQIIGKSKRCRCFYCLATFAPKDVKEWHAEGVSVGSQVIWLGDEVTACCPKCSVDSVIGDSSGVNLKDDDLFFKLEKFWFQCSGRPRRKKART